MGVLNNMETQEELREERDEILDELRLVEINLGGKEGDLMKFEKAFTRIGSRLISLVQKYREVDLTKATDSFLNRLHEDLTSIEGILETKLMAYKAFSGREETIPGYEPASMMCEGLMGRVRRAMRDKAEYEEFGGGFE